MNIHIHIGVHKTATTYMQERLHANLWRLNKAGVGFLSTAKFRTSFWERFMVLDPETFQIEDHLSDFFPHGVPSKILGLLISEENLIGLCGRFVKSGKPFNGVRPRLSHFRKLLSGHEVTMFCAVRAYDTFLSSVYCEGIRTSRDFVTFDVFRDRLDWAIMNWPVLISRFEQGLTPDKTVLWKYENFSELSEDIFRQLVFGQSLGPDKARSNDVTHQSFSQTAIDAIASVAAQVGNEVAGRLMVPIANALLKSDGFPVFDPWSDDERQELRVKYEKHCGQMDPQKWLIPHSEAAQSQRVA